MASELIKRHLEYSTIKQIHKLLVFIWKTNPKRYKRLRALSFDLRNEVFDSLLEVLPDAEW